MSMTRWWPKCGRPCPRSRPSATWRSCLRFSGTPPASRILLVLFQSEVCVYDLAKLLNMTQSAISHQLRLLKQARLVKSRREGKIVFYSLADSHVRTMLDQGMEHIRE